MSNRLTGMALAASMLGNVYLIVQLLSAGVSLDHARSTSELLLDRRAQALQILNRDWVGRSDDQLVMLAIEMEKGGAIVKRYEEVIEIGDFDFQIADGVVKSVRDIDSLEERARAQEERPAGTPTEVP